MFHSKRLKTLTCNVNHGDVNNVVPYFKKAMAVSYFNIFLIIIVGLITKDIE